MLYVEQLVAPDVIDTMPPATLHAFADHGDVSGPPAPDDAAAEDTLGRAAAAGVDLDAITSELEREGVRAFCESYRELLDSIATRLRPLVG